MQKNRKTVDLAKFAAEARADIQAGEPGVPADERLQKLLSNIGKTVILPTHLLEIQGNIRQILDTSAPEFRQLVESVRKSGVKQNLIGDVRVSSAGRWEIICVAGQRRLLAAKEVGLEAVPVRLEQYTDTTSLLVDSLSENILRQNLHSLDAALGYLRLFNLGWTPDSIAEAFERKRDTVMKMLRLARYPVAAQEIIRMYPEKFTSTILLTKFVAKSWSDDHSLIAALQEFATKDRKRPLRTTITDYEVKELESVVNDKGLRLIARGSKQNGQITLNWASEEEFLEVRKLIVLQVSK